MQLTNQITITVDSRQCGAGKTTNTIDGIYSKINANLKSNKKTIVVAGSKALQYQYKDVYSNMLVINSDNIETSVLKDITSAMEYDINLVCITHQAFILLEYTLLRNGYDCIIDEALSGLIEEHKISLTNKHFVDVKWNNHFLLEVDTHDGQLTYEQCQTAIDGGHFSRDEFYKLTFQGATNNNTILSEQYRKITSRNKHYFITMYDYNIMMGNNDKVKIFSIYSVVNDRLFTGWNSIHIAASAFHKTQMNYVMKYNGIECLYTQKFKKHSGNIKLHSVSNMTQINGKNKTFKWSNYKRKNNKEILDSYHEYVNTTATGKVLSLRNITEDSSLSNEDILSHNVHGMNKEEWQSCTNISMESALRPSNEMIKFIKDVVLDGEYDNNEKHLDEIITDMFSSYLFYQAIMRCKLRDRSYNNEEVNIFTLDSTVALNFADYFDINEDDYYSFEVNWNKKNAMTQAERKKKSRLNKKEKVELLRKQIEELNDTDVLLNMSRFSYKTSTKSVTQKVKHLNTNNNDKEINNPISATTSSSWLHVIKNNTSIMNIIKKHNNKQ